MHFCAGVYLSSPVKRKTKSGAKDGERTGGSRRNGERATDGKSVKEEERGRDRDGDGERGGYVLPVFTCHVHGVNRHVRALSYGARKCLVIKE